MKTLLGSLTILLFAGLFFVSCENPTTVDATRKVTNTSGTPHEVAVTADVTVINFGFVSYHNPTSMSAISPTAKRHIIISNTSEKEPAIISSLSFASGVSQENPFYGKKNFSVQNDPASIQFPLTLAPKGQPGSSVDLVVGFDPFTFGHCTDSLVIHQDKASLSIPLLADVPVVWVDDGNFGEISFSENKTLSIGIHNMGDAPATITATSISGPDAGAFKQSLHIIPFTLQPGEEAVVNISLSLETPGNPGSMSAEYILNIQYSGTGTVDNISALTAIRK